MDFLNLLQQFSNRLNLGAVEIEDSRIARLKVKNNLFVSIEADENHSNLFMMAPVCRIPDEQERLAYFDLFMQANSFGVMTNDAYFCANPDSNEVILFKRKPITSLNGESMEIMFNEFLETLVNWIDLIEDGHISSQLRDENKPSVSISGYL